MEEVQEVFKESLYHATTHIIIPVMLLCALVGVILIFIKAKLDKALDKIIQNKRMKMKNKKNNRNDNL